MEALGRGKEDFPLCNLSCMTPCEEGMLLAWENGQVACVDRTNMQVRWQLQDIVEQLQGNVTETFTLFLDRDGELWIYGIPGVWVYNLKEKKWKDYLKASGHYTGPHDMVRVIEQDAAGNIWIGKDQGGIEVLNKRTGERTLLTHRPEDERSLSNNTIASLYPDSEGGMWVGTFKKGVAYYNRSIYKFDIFPLGDINCIEESPDGCLWLGTNGNGLVRWNPEDGESKSYTHGAENSPSTNAIVSLLQARDGRLWIGMFMGGLDCFDGSRFLHYRYRAGAENSLASDKVWSLLEDASGNIWIGTLGGGLQCLNPQTGEFKTYTKENSGLIFDYVTSICQADEEHLVIGTSRGISLFDMRRGRAQNLTDEHTGTVYFRESSINQVLVDSRGLLWVGTRDGLEVLDRKNGLLKSVLLAQEGGGQYVAGMVEDKQRNIWVTTSGGVFSIHLTQDVRTEEYSFTYNLYDSKDGLQAGEFNQRSMKLLNGGTVAMGGLTGINLFNPAGIHYNRHVPHVMFTGLRLFNEDVKVGRAYDGRVILQEALNSVGEVMLDYRQNVFTVLFASDNYVLPDKTRYLYKLEGFNDDWMTAPMGMHEVTYTNLAPGTYRLCVKAVNNDGVEGAGEARLKIVIYPPLWRSTGAYVFYVLLLGMIIFFTLRGIQQRERNRFRMQRMQEDAKKQEELNQMKFRFFTNVSHELRTPLTLIISPLEGIMKETTDETLLNKMALMHRNARRLLTLVNQLLDFRKNEMAGMHLTPSEGDVVLFVRNICNSFLAFSENKHVHLTFFSPIKQLQMSFDEDKLGKVVMNLLSNAFKFTPDDGRVDVSLEVSKEMPDTLVIKVADSGIGIKDEDKKHIFERFYQVEQDALGTASTGSGIGLSLVRDYVTLHGGEVQVVDNVSQGSVFIVRIPIKHVASTSTEVVETSSVEDVAVGALGTDQQAVPEKPLVLLVDDNEDFIAFMKDSLNLYYRTCSASNGKEAWDMIPRLMPDIIVCDVMMPEMDGNELCRRVKQDKRMEHIPFVLLTAKLAVEDKLEGLGTGADDYVTKPFNVEVLLLRLRKLIELSQRHEPRGRIDPTPSEIVITSLDEKLVADAIRYVEANMARPDLSVEELSQALGMSRVHLYKKLSQITGKTPIEFIRIIRLKRAAQFLRESGQNVSEIAYQVGFNNPKYFSRYFKEEFGVLPSVYQEREGNNRK